MSSPSPDPRTDRQLVAESLAGDRQAFEILLRRHEDTLYIKALELVGDSDGAQDVVQEAFLDAYRCLERSREDESVLNWLCRLVTNAAAMLKQKRGQWQSESDPA